MRTLILCIACLCAAAYLPVTSASGKSERVAAEASSERRVGERLPQSKRKDKSSGGYKETVWDALIPPDWEPMNIFKGLDLDKLNDADPRAMEALDRLRREWNNAPVNPAFNGTRIRIPGFVVPLENHRDRITEFLLVPYFGACIHVPPPPANQIIHVVAAKPLQHTKTMDAVWVSGVIETVRSSTGMGDAGYRMKGELITPYKFPTGR